MFPLTPRSLLFPVGFLAAAATMLAADNAPLLQQQSVGGTYRIAICKRQPCSPDDTTNIAVSGVIVLSDSNYTLAAFPDTVRFSLLRYAMSRRNGCSATAPRRASPGTYAAIGGMELLMWTRPGPDRVAFGLHKQAGIEYQVEIDFSGDRFKGTGKSVRDDGVAPEYTDDIVVGVKSGASDHKPCADSATVWLRKKR